MATRKRKKSGHELHPGVVLVAPKTWKRQGWIARYRDPDTGRAKQETLPERVTTAEAREDWARAKSQDLAKRRVQLDEGAVRKTGTSLADAVDGYFKAHTRLSEGTKSGYRSTADKLIAWCAQHKVTKTDDLTRKLLLRFRESIVNEPRRAYVTGAGRGARAEGTELRSAETVNGELRRTRTVLGYLRTHELLPKLSNDDLRDALKRIQVVYEQAEFLKPGELQLLLASAKKHDAETFAETRAEHAGEGRKTIGTTPRYPAIAPFLTFTLLTGMRLGEALGVEWEDVDLDAIDADEHAVGEVKLWGAKNKTKRARTVDLAVSPALRAMLLAMKPKDAKGRVFAVTRGEAETAQRRLRDEYGAPTKFSWQVLRSTCATYLTNAPGIFGAASAYRSAKQLGHSVVVAEKHYAGLIRVPRTAKTLEAAMGLSPRSTQAAPDAVTSDDSSSGH